MPLTHEHLLIHLERKFGLDVSQVKSDTPLFSSGLVDSFSLVDLILFIETSANLRMETLDVSFDNLDTIDRILNYVSSRSGG